jgi:hypothetical protein
MKWIEMLRGNFKLRPFWMNVLMLFCAYMTFIYVPWDILFKPVVDAQEVWFGFLLTGWAAKVTEPIHLLIYGAGTVGFWKMKSWMHPWACVYAAQVALGMCVWSFLYQPQQGIVAGFVISLPFIILAVALWRTKNRYS